MTRRAASPRSKLRLSDLGRVGVVGLRARRLRTLLTALGIAIGIAAMVAVVGISASSKADLIAEIDALGTDLLRVQPGQTVFGESTTLPERSRDVADRIGPVTTTAGITTVERDGAPQPADRRRRDRRDPRRRRRSHHARGDQRQAGRRPIPRRGDRNTSRRSSSAPTPLPAWESAPTTWRATHGSGSVTSGSP